MVGPIQRSRRWLAGKILGDDTVLFVARQDAALLRSADYLSAPDETVGLMFKHFWSIVTRKWPDEADREGWGFRAKMRSACVLYLASEMVRANGQSADYSVRGSLNGGRSEGAWAVRIEQAPDFGTTEPQVVEVAGKIVSLAVSMSNPGYEEWRAANAARLAASIEPTTPDTLRMEIERSREGDGDE